MSAALRTTAALIVAGLLFATLGALPANATPTRPTGPLVPASGALFGQWLSPPTHDAATQQAVVQRREQELGRKWDIDHYYYAWDAVFPNWRQRWDVAEGRIPMLSWDAAPSTEVAGGVHDDLIRARAQGLRGLGSEVFLRYGWEMDGKKNAHWAGTPAQYVAAWRRAHDLFAQEGATNVVWVWCPNSGAFSDGTADQWYPGDAYVDWVCADGYNWAPAQSWAQWRSFADTFAPFHAWGMARNKPMMVGETGVQERAVGEKAAWLRAAQADLPTKLPGIAAVMYFDSDTIYPWWTDSRPDSFEAFSAFANDPYMTTRATALPASVAFTSAATSTPPTVLLRKPLAGAAVTGTMLMTADAVAEAGVARVEFFVDGNLVGVDTTAPYSMPYDSRGHANGPARVEARVLDRTGAGAMSQAASVTVANTTVTLSAPADGTIVAGGLTLDAAAVAAPGRTVTRVRFYASSLEIGADTTAPYAVTVDTATLPNGPTPVYATVEDGSRETGRTTTTILSVFNRFPPKVQLTAPAEGAGVRGQVWLSADAAPGAGAAVARVEFLVDGVKVGEDTTAGYGLSWSSTRVANGVHTVTARVVDNAGAATVHSRTVTVTNAAAAVTAPAAGANLSGIVTLTASATPALGASVTRVEFFVNGSKVGEDLTAPYSLPWDSRTKSAGTKTVSVKATDSSGQTARSADVTFVTGTLSVALTSPADGAVVSGSVRLAAAAGAGAGATVTRVEFLVDGVKVGEDTTSGYGVSWASKKVSNGVHTVTARVTDSAGGTMTHSRTVTVANVTVALTSPTTGTTAQGGVTMTAVATPSAGASVTRVEFYVAGVKVGEDTTAPYSITWDSRTVSNGTRAVYAKVTDTAGRSANSAKVSLTTRN